MKPSKSTKSRQRSRPIPTGKSVASISAPRVESKVADVESLTKLDLKSHGKPIAIAIAILCLTTLGLYSQTLAELEYQWRTEADYSHGYLVPVLSLGLLYSRRDTFPGLDGRLHWSGIGLLLLAILMRTMGQLYFMEFLTGWSIVPWLAGSMVLLAGGRAFWWAMPALAFLVFMVPLPYQIESLLSWKLQSLVTVLSSTILRILGFPAVPEGNTIWIGQSQMLVEEACSGLRIFVGMAAFGFFWASLIKRAWIDKFIVLAAIIPLSIIANTVRSVIICIGYYWFDDVLATRIHDWAGIFMIILAATLVWLVKGYWERVYRPVWIYIPADRLRTD